MHTTQQVESRVIASAKLWGQNRIENKNDHSHVPHLSSGSFRSKNIQQKTDFLNELYYIFLKLVLLSVLPSPCFDSVGHIESSLQ